MSDTSWSAKDIPPQTGKRILITGANSGIGFHAALQLAGKGALILLGARDKSRGEAALARLRAQSTGPENAADNAELVLFDLASLASVRDAAARILDHGLPLHGLINNAGVMAPPKRLETVDGFELQFGTNVLGHFALTAHLMPALKLAIPEKPRLVTIASIAHKTGRIAFDDLQSIASYSPRGSYSQSKLANLMLAFEMERRFQHASLDILSIAAHPGVANTNLFVTGNFPPLELAMRRLAGHAIDALLNTDAEGAIPTLYAATAPDAVGGGYYGSQGLLEMRGGDVGPAKIAARAQDEEAARRLWSICEELTGVTFPG